MNTQATRSEEEPDYNILRNNGWSVNVACGRYCVAWRDQDEVVLVWGANGWRRVPDSVDVRKAA